MVFTQKRLVHRRCCISKAGCFEETFQCRHKTETFQGDGGEHHGIGCCGNPCLKEIEDCLEFPAHTVVLINLAEWRSLDRRAGDWHQRQIHRKGEISRL